VCSALDRKLSPIRRGGGVDCGAPACLPVFFRSFVMSNRRSSVIRAALLAVFASALVSAAAMPAFAAETAKTLTPQQQRMADCNKQATGKSGDARKAFMSSCLKGESAAPQTQQEKMKSCNADASKKSLKGDERKTFMSSCLKGDAAAATH
jgi:psiF repeat